VIHLSRTTPRNRPTIVRKPSRRPSRRARRPPWKLSGTHPWTSLDLCPLPPGGAAEAPLRNCPEDPLEGGFRPLTGGWTGAQSGSRSGSRSGGSEEGNRKATGRPHEGPRKALGRPLEGPWKVLGRPTGGLEKPLGGSGTLFLKLPRKAWRRPPEA